MIRFLHIVIFLGFVTGLQSQNLLLNGNFEDCSDCPKVEGALEICNHWTIPNVSTPDLFKACGGSFGALDVPVNATGFQEPYAGDAYVGIVILSALEKIPNYREYIQGELREPMEANTAYNIYFYLNWADRSNYFCDRIGYKLSSEKSIPNPDDKQFKKTKKSKQVKSDDKTSLNTIIPKSDGYILLDFDTLSDRDSWHKVEFIYHAKGGEKYLILGLFGDNATEDDFQRYVTNPYGKPQRNIGDHVYYLIDNIVVEKLDFTHR